jgi:hypothetical protein
MELAEGHHLKKILAKLSTSYWIVVGSMAQHIVCLH